MKYRTAPVLAPSGWMIPPWTRVRGLESNTRSVLAPSALLRSGDGTTTFPMRIYNANKTEIPPQIHVIASMILFVTVGLMAIGAFRTLKRTSAPT